MLAVAHPGKQSWRRWLIVAAVVLAIVAIPPLLSERYVNSAYEGWRDDPEQAYSDLDAAHSIYPLSDTPLLVEGAIARELGDEERAIEALADAVDFRPWEWAGHFLLAELYADSNPLLARNEARIALELNPRSERVQDLAAELGVVAESLGCRDQPAAQREGDGLRAGAGAELRLRVADVRLHGRG